MDRRLFAAAGRALGFAEFGDPDGTPVLWCHGGPGSRLEPLWLDESAARAGLRIIGVDRPGYGMSDPLPGRSIRDGVADMIAVAEALSIDRFATVGCSTGGSYALAAAAVVPDRVLAVVACCSMTDMSWLPGRATMSQPHAHAVWDAPDRDAAIAAAVEAHGENGSKMLGGGMAPGLGGFDNDIFADPVWMKAAMTGFAQMFTHGLQGYADDRIADGPGWIDFDVAWIVCPVSVLHGTADRMVDVIHARHTADIVPGAEWSSSKGTVISVSRRSSFRNSCDCSADPARCCDQIENIARYDACHRCSCHRTMTSSPRQIPR
jgi:pimeloyl-ACP methyl ester carboxylesterase